MIRLFSGDPGGDGNFGLPLTEEVGVVPLEGGVALLEVLEGGREIGVTPLGGVAGGEFPRRCGFLGGRSGGIFKRFFGEEFDHFPLEKFWALS